ncbi:MAG TPA: AMP-binding protein [Candidatus Microbacterium pullistercoris]|nr:AMP-binding protein [Candidatus Microbacterium pullistercoris]
MTATAFGPGTAPTRDQPIHAYVAEHARERPDHDAIIFGDTAISYATLEHQAIQLAAYLAERGIGKGDTVALFMQNSPQFIVSFLAIQRLGAVVGPCNPMFKEWELGYQLQDLGATVLITFDELVEVFRHVEKSDVHTVVCASFSDVVTDPTTIPVDASAAVVRDSGAAETVRFADIVAGHRPEPAPVEIDMVNDPSLVIYTSGTTGKPKGAMLSYRNAEFKTACLVGTYGFSQDDVFCSVMPIFHIAGMVVGLTSPLMVGATIVLEARFDADIMVKDVARTRTTVLYLTPPIALELLEANADLPASLHDVRLTLGTSFGRQITRELSDRWQDVAGVPFFEWAYGMSETHTGDTLMPPEAVRYGAHGKPTFETELRIVDREDSSRDLPAGEVGEILVRSPSVFLGYRGRPEATAEVLINGWYHTGDLGRVDNEGYLHFDGRSKEMIKSSGYSVFPEEVEGMLVRHDDVVQAAVVGFADPKRGESVRAFVVVRDGAQVTEEDIVMWSRERMAAYKYPRDVRFIDALPHTTTGKLQRTKLRQMP